MRVLHFTDTIRMGGAEHHLISIVQCEQSHGHEVEVLSPQRFVLDAVATAVPQAELIHIDDRGFQNVRTSRARVVAIARVLRELRSVLRQRSPDLLHVNNGGYPGSDLCRIAPLAGRLARVPRRVMTVHSMPWLREHSDPRIQAVSDAMVWRNVDAVLGPARVLGRRLAEMRGMPEAAFRYVPGGVEAPGSAGETAALRERLLGGRRLLLGMVAASNDPEKGHEIFIEALGRVPDAAGVIVGPPPGAEASARMRDLGLEDRLSIEGPQRAADAYHHAFDVLIVPSTEHECLPVVILEAMAAGKPVIASRLAGIPEAVEDGTTGWLFAPGAIPELVSRIEDCLRSPAGLAELGEAGRKRWAEGFSPERMWSAYREAVAA